MSADFMYLRHILDAIKKVDRYAAVGKEAFMGESHWHDAAIRQLEIIGEATKNLSDAIRTKHADVPWRRMAGMRDVLIHGYMGVDLEAVWEVAQAQLPPLKEQILRILHELDTETK